MKSWMKKAIIVLIILAILLVIGVIFWQNKTEKEENRVGNQNMVQQDMKVENTDKLGIVVSLEDKIKDNTAWCGTFNLIWNDLKNDLAKQDIVFTPQKEIVENLNKETFNTSHLSENSYYKVYGTPSLELKAEIEKAIKKKFNETSDILDDFDWNHNSPEDYFLYCMLKKEFEFPKVFMELENGKFGDYENVQYFGIDGSSDEEVRNQVEVLYYHSKEDFAIKLITKTDDEVIITRGNKEDTFGDMYAEMIRESENYDGIYEFSEEDRLQIPNLKFDLKEEIKEVENQPFLFSNGNEYVIEKALQTIQFELDKKGGKIKSEAGMMMKETAAIMPQEPREFIVDDTFTIFLKEQGKELPYFAAKISDISQVQSDATKMENTQASEEQENPYFYGKVVEAKQNYILVEPNEGEEIRKSADKISIGLGEKNDAIYEVGTNVKITYDGTVMESYPAQINAIDIEVKSAEDFEIRFYDKSYESQQKVRSILDKMESEKYDYNIYAYMGEVNILINGEEMPLRDALLENKITMDEIIAKVNQDWEDEKIQGDMYNDGGTIEYHYADYTIIKMHNLDGNRDVYIGTPGMTLNNLER